jgi:hypothetical protein
MSKGLIILSKHGADVLDWAQTTACITAMTTGR